jgi:hypothetical protein
VAAVTFFPAKKDLLPCDAIPSLELLPPPTSSFWEKRLFLVLIYHTTTHIKRKEDRERSFYRGRLLFW